MILDDTRDPVKGTGEVRTKEETCSCLDLPTPGSKVSEGLGENPGSEVPPPSGCRGPIHSPTTVLPVLPVLDGLRALLSGGPSHHPPSSCLDLQ